MTIRILINGASGKMGQAAVKAVSNTPEFTLAAETHRNDNLAEKITQSRAQIVIDFTNAHVVLKNIETIIEAGAHPLSVHQDYSSRKLKHCKSGVQKCS